MSDTIATALRQYGGDWKPPLLQDRVDFVKYRGIDVKKKQCRMGTCANAFQKPLNAKIKQCKVSVYDSIRGVGFCFRHYHEILEDCEISLDTDQDVSILLVHETKTK